MNKILEPYIVGMDAGGTKTKVTLLTLDKKPLVSFEGGGMNVNSFGEEISEANLRNMLTLLNQYDEGFRLMQGWGVGIAGISNPVTHLMLRSGAEKSGVKVTPVVGGDHIAALMGAHLGGDGIILIAGTGSICCGKRGDMVKRSGGYGHLIDDEGSAYAIGRDVLSCVVRSEDGRNAPTVMKQAVLDKLNLTEMKELIPFVYDPTTTKKDIAQVAPVVMLGYEAGETAAKHILDKAARELFSMADAVKRQLELEEASLALCGSVLTKNKVLRDMLQKEIDLNGAKIRIVEPKEDAAYGAALMAMDPKV